MFDLLDTEYKNVRTDRVKKDVLGDIAKNISWFLFEHLGNKYNALNVEVQKKSKYTTNCVAECCITSTTIFVMMIRIRVIF